MIIRIVKMTFRKEECEAFEELFNSVKDAISSFEGCKFVELIRSMDEGQDSCVYFTRSIWDKEESLEKYRKSPLFAETWKNTKAKFADRPQAWSTQQVSFSKRLV